MQKKVIEQEIFKEQDARGIVSRKMSKEKSQKVF